MARTFLVHLTRHGTDAVRIDKSVADDLPNNVTVERTKAGVWTVRILVSAQTVQDAEAKAHRLIRETLNGEFLLILTGHKADPFGPLRA